jgi:hypothetical protein
VKILRRSVRNFGLRGEIRQGTKQRKGHEMVWDELMVSYHYWHNLETTKGEEQKYTAANEEEKWEDETPGAKVDKEEKAMLTVLPYEEAYIELIGTIKKWLKSADRAIPNHVPRANLFSVFLKGMEEAQVTSEQWSEQKEECRH